MLLVTAATSFKLAAFPNAASFSLQRLVTGVGVPETFARLVAPPTPLPELILNIGIAGAYPDTGIAIGDIVLADGEVYGDIGFELPTEAAFQPITGATFGAFYAEPLPTVRPALWQVEPPSEAGFKVHVARGCTVGTCTGTMATGVRRRDRFGVGFESMEGAAVAQIGRSWGVPVCEIRAISNIAAERDMRPENIRLALANLQHYLERCLRGTD